jgi:septum formation protein
MQIILASTSPRRKELLGLLKIPFFVMEPDCEEDGEEGLSAKELVQHLACQKAQSIAAKFPETLVLGGDTVIEIDGEILGKPQNLNDAETMLRRLSGRIHQVHSGISLVCKSRKRILTDVEIVQVQMKKFSESEIQAYLGTGESLGKAGAYCIQEEGAKLIEKISGDYPTVVGLPLKKVAELLEEEGVELPVSIEEIYGRKPYPKWKEFS